MRFWFDKGERLYSYEGIQFIRTYIFSGGLYERWISDDSYAGI